MPDVGTEVPPVSALLTTNVLHSLAVIYIYIYIYIYVCMCVIDIETISMMFMHIFLLFSILPFEQTAESMSTRPGIVEVERGQVGCRKEVERRPAGGSSAYSFGFRKYRSLNN